MALTKLNQLTEDTEIKANVQKNLTVITITAGLHPDDLETLLNSIAAFTKTGCEKTRLSIDALNGHLDYLGFSLNVE